MTSLKNFITLLLTLTLINTQAQQGFQLTGTAPATFEGSMIYLSTLDYSDLNYRLIDSTRVKDGRFEFTGRLPHTAMLTTIAVKQPKFGMCQFFLENRHTTITIHATTARNALDACSFTNAPVQEQFRLLKEKLQPVEALTIRQYQKMDTAMAKADSAGKQQLNDELIALFRKEKQETVEFIKENPGLYISLFKLCYHIGGGPITYPDSLQKLLNGLTTSLQQTPEATALQKRIQLVKASGVGQTARWKTIPTEQNIPLTLAGYKGKYVLLDFWASWCGPCIQNLPDVKELYNNWHKENFDIIGISLDEDRNKWTDAIKKHTLPWVQASDLKGWKNAIAELYDIRSIPQYILIAPDGKIMANSGDLSIIKKQLETSLKQTTGLKQ